VNRRIDVAGHVGQPANRSAANAGSDRLPVWRIGITSGVVGLLCCVCPTILALLGIVSAATAFAWANNLYENYAWWFRLGGLAVLAALIWLSLRRQDQCSIEGIRRRRKRLVAVAAIAVGTYAVLYAVTTWLGTFV
jgi:hypothetical protein